MLLPGPPKRAGQPLEQRVRGWLGLGHSDFDVAIVVVEDINPADVAVANVLSLEREDL